MKAGEHMQDLNKFVLQFGVHRGTRNSRDVDKLEFDTEKDLMDKWAKLKAGFTGTGMYIWFASMKRPGQNSALEQFEYGDPYEV